MHARILRIPVLASVLLATACSSKTDAPGEAPNCDGKCDGGTVEAPVVARCWTEGSSFLCTVPLSSPLRVNKLDVRVKDSADAGTGLYRSSRSTPGGTERAVLADVPSYPQYFQIVLDFNGAQPTQIVRTMLPLEYPLTLTSAQQYTADRPLVLTLPFHYWSVELLNPHAPNAVILSKSAGIDLRPMLVRDGSAKYTADVTGALVVDGGQRAQTFLFPVDDRVDRVTLDITIGDAFFDHVQPITYKATVLKPGRYVLGDSGLRAPTTEEAAMFGPAATTPDADDTTDTTDAPETDTAPASETTEPTTATEPSEVTVASETTDPSETTVVESETTVVVDPCAGQCSGSEVCVGGNCKRLSEQTEGYGASCDGDDNADCASSHVCVGGSCQRLSEQTEGYGASCDGDDNADCASSHACVGGSCQRLSEQTEGYGASCDGDDNADCASSHVCVGGSCQRLSEQTANYGGLCDGDDNADCYTGYVCVGGTCRNLSQQTESNGAICDDDGDCATGHTCSTEGRCVH